MSEPKHTPGPWRIGTDGKTVLGGSDGEWLIGDTRHSALGHEADLANARLIAAAPELLDALRDLREAATDAYKTGRIPAEPFVRAGNVIAKATR